MRNAITHSVLWSVKYVHKLSKNLTDKCFQNTYEHSQNYGTSESEIALSFVPLSMTFIDSEWRNFDIVKDIDFNSFAYYLELSLN